MQSAKKRTIALSALSMAAVATLGAKSAQAVTGNLSFYYDNVNVLSAQSPSSQESVSGGGNIAAQGTVVTNLSSLDGSTSPTVTLQVGQVLEFGLDAALTGITYTASNTGSGATKLPQYFGAAYLDIGINSTNSSGSLLGALNDGTGSRATAGPNTYNSTAYLNSSGSAQSIGDQGNQPGTDTGSQNGTASAAGNKNANKYVPNWGATEDVGDATGGVIGSDFIMTGGNSAASSGQTAGVQILGAFGASTNAFSQATDFFDSLQYSANATGTVTLSPYSPFGNDAYWTQTSGTTGTTSHFAVHNFTAADTVQTIPQLVVVIAGGSSTTPLFSLTTALPGAAYGSQITNGTGNLQGTFTGSGASANKLTLVGGSGYYGVQQATGITGSANDNYIEANGFSPASDKELFALDVQVGGTQASPTQLDTLLADANAIGGLGTGVSVATSAPAPDAFPGIYNFFVEASPGVGADDFLGFDLLSTNDSNLAGYSVSAVAVVPEPMSLGLLALGGVGLMARRNRRKA